MVNYNQMHESGHTPETRTQRYVNLIHTHSSFFRFSSLSGAYIETIIDKYKVFCENLNKMSKKGAKDSRPPSLYDYATECSLNIVFFHNSLQPLPSVQSFLLAGNFLYNQ